MNENPTNHNSPHTLDWQDRILPATWKFLKDSYGITTFENVSRERGVALGVLAGATNAFLPAVSELFHHVDPPWKRQPPSDETQGEIMDKHLRNEIRLTGFLFSMLVDAQVNTLTVPLSYAAFSADQPELGLQLLAARTLYNPLVQIGSRTVGAIRERLAARNAPKANTP